MTQSTEWRTGEKLYMEQIATEFLKEDATDSSHMVCSELERFRMWMRKRYPALVPLEWRIWDVAKSKRLKLSS